MKTCPEQSRLKQIANYLMGPYAYYIIFFYYYRFLRGQALAFVLLLTL